MGKINILGDNISNKIAAGEVVERPASVVKELVENSIDAGAASITVEIRNGGISYIRVSDNGYGMDEEDAKLSFTRHATSKIKSESDLNSITTLGFRGEALASIASVSEVEMTTKQRNSTFGTKVEICGGEFKYIGSTGCPDGTSITVKNLFYNTPARLKFLKKESRESAAVSDIIYNLALSKPDIGFKFINNGKLVFNTPGDGNLQNTILTLFGKQVYDSLIEVSYKGNVLSINGYIGSPDIARSNRNHQIFFINNRYIKNRRLSVAVDNAYKTFLTVNKFAFCILFITIMPELVDVNVHPTKAEVRFQDEQEVFSAIFNTVRNGLAGEVLIPDVTYNEEPIKKEEPIKTEQIQMLKEEQVLTREQPIIIKEDKLDDTYIKLPPPLKPVTKNEKRYSEINDININHEEAIAEDPKNLLPPLVIIGQCLYTYILCQGPDGLYIIDQHAAHERILYERYKCDYAKGGVQAQNLLAPIVIDLVPRELLVIKDNRDIIEKLGFEFEFFGNNSVILRSVPIIFGEPQLKKFLLELIDMMDENALSNKSIIDNLIYTMACKSAIKANDRLDIKEMEELIKALRCTVNPYTCPHGRPTIIKITQNELEKKFKRIQ